MIYSSEWIHARESHKGRVYYPTPKNPGKSGITLDPGFDIGQHERAEVERMLRQVYRLEHERDIRFLLAGAGLKGHKAIEHLVGGWLIPISREQALRALDDLLPRYWSAAVRRWPSVADAPVNAMTAVLSLAYNAGPSCRIGRVFGMALARQDYREAAEILRDFGARGANSLNGLRKRRRLEAELMAGLRTVDETDENVRAWP